MKDPLFGSPALGASEAKVIRISSCDSSEQVPALDLEWKGRSASSVRASVAASAPSTGWTRRSHASDTCWTKVVDGLPTALISYEFQGFAVAQFRVVRASDEPCGAFP